MSIQAVLLPVFVQVALTFVLLFWTGISRLGAVRRGETKVSSVALGQQNWPPNVMQIANSYNNQLQAPVLFYVLVALTLIVRRADMLFVVMSWLFVVSRLLHAYIHVTSNHVVHRFRTFVVGVVILMAMWTIFAARLFAGHA